MALWTWWVGDALPQLEPTAGFSAAVADDPGLLARMANLDIEEVQARLRAGHRPYVAYLDGVAVAYGWVAEIAASIGELGLTFDLRREDRYLWDFATLPDWRGRGVYPRLLQAILADESAAARRFWIINAPENAPSAAGIAKAGFQATSDLSFLAEAAAGSAVRGSAERARIGATLLGVPLVQAVNEGRVLSPCWRCVLDRHEGVDGSCWPPATPSHACTCVTAQSPA